MATTDNRLPTEGTQIDIEARLAAIETALASLMADTTGHSIASAISGLNTTQQAILNALNPFKSITVTLSVGTTTANTAVNLGTLNTVTNGVITVYSQIKAMSFIGGGGSGNYASGDLTIVSNTLRWYPRVNDTNVSITLAFIYLEN